MKNFKFFLYTHIGAMFGALVYTMCDKNARDDCMKIADCAFKKLDKEIKAIK